MDSIFPFISAVSFLAGEAENQEKTIGLSQVTDKLIFR
jgi:hypothetical protein